MFRVRDFRVRDARRQNWVDRFVPLFLRPYLKLSRYDRPIGFWLLFFPAATGFLLAVLPDAKDILSGSLYRPVNFFIGYLADITIRGMDGIFPFSSGVMTSLIYFFFIFLDLLWQFMIIFSGALVMRGGGLYL